MNVNFTINGVEVAMEMPCYGPDLFRINSENPAGMKDALRELVNVVNDQLPAAVQDMGEQIGNALDGGGGGAVDGDHVWTQRGGGLPAVGEGGMGGDTVIGHINNYGGAGAHVPGVALGAAPTANAVAMIDDILLDPVRHVASAVWAWAARPFTCTNPIVYTPDVVSHDVVGATATTEAYVPGQFLQKLHLTAEGHVKTPVAGDFGAPAALPLAVRIAHVGVAPAHTGDTLTSCAADAGVWNTNGDAHFSLIDLGNGCPHDGDVYSCIGFDGTKYYFASLFARLAGTT